MSQLQTDIDRLNIALARADPSPATPAGGREIESLTGHKIGIISALSAITLGRRRLRAPKGGLPPRCERVLWISLSTFANRPSVPTVWPALHRSNVARQPLFPLAEEYTGRGR